MTRSQGVGVALDPLEFKRATLRAHQRFDGLNDDFGHAARLCGSEQPAREHGREYRTLVSAGVCRHELEPLAQGPDCAGL